MNTDISTEKALQKLYDILNEKVRIDLYNYLDKEDNLSKENLLNTYIIKKYIKNREENSNIIDNLFAEFKRLSNVLDQTNISIKEKFLIVLYFIKENLEKIEKCNQANLKAIFIKEDDLKNYNFKTIKVKEIEKMSDNKTLKEFMNSENEKLTDEEITQRDELRAFAKSNIHQTQKVISHFKTIKHSYMEKENTYTELDIKKIINALNKLNMSNTFCNSLKEYLCHQLNKRKKEQIQIYVKKEELKSNEKESYEERKTRLKKIEKILYNYIDFDNLTANGPLSYEEQAIVTSYLIEYGTIKEKQLLEFLKRTNHDYPIHEKVINEYLRVREKLSYYHLEYPNSNIMDECFQELFFTNNKSEDYSILIELLEEYIKDASQYIPNDYQYELEQGKKLYQSRIKSKRI